ncbi:MAG TPA: LamG domain-containing protein, partial [Lacipirellula sp.]
VGLTVADSSPAGRHAGISNGSPTWISGMRSNALSLNGSVDEAITNNKFKPPATGTVAFWFKRNAAAIGRERPFGLATDWEAWQDPDGILRFDLDADGEQGGFKTLTSLSEVDRWYHVAAVFDAATDAFAIYVDGQLHHSGISTRDLVAQTAARLSFGTRTGATEHFNGAIDDFRVFNRKLTAAEVSEIYGLLAWYKLDETSGTVAADSTGLGNSGAYVGSPVLGVASNGNGAMGTAVTFNGSNNVQVSGMYGNPANVSVSAWIKMNAADSSGAEIISLGDHFLLRIRPGGVGLDAVYYNGSTWMTASTSLPVGAKWRHVAATFTQSGALAIYVDGLEMASTPAGSISYAGLGQNTSIATHGNSSTTYDYAGTIDDVRVYDRGLGPMEVFRLFQGSRLNGLRIIKWVEVR